MLEAVSPDHGSVVCGFCLVLWCIMLRHLLSSSSVSPLRRSLQTSLLKRATLCSSATALPDRDVMEYDVLTIGAGPAGLSAAIKLKQLSIEKGIDLSVCVVEKSSEVGGHILSGNVFEPRALNELIPDWKEKGAPLETPAGDDQFLYLTETGSIEVPHLLLPPELNNHGNYIISLSQLVRWLGQQAEELGVEIYPGFAADEVLYNEDGSVRGVATKDAGISKDGSLSSGFTRGVELVAKQTLFAEGCRGSCSTEVIDKFDLQKDKNIQTYGLGVKEVWQVPEENLKPGLIQHSIGWPLQSSPFSDVYGGTFLYHSKPNIIQLGNPTPPSSLSPSSSLFAVLTPLVVVRDGGWVGL
jgi:electron-transferring-flavoprotein dehydrogenase